MAEGAVRNTPVRIARDWIMINRMINQMQWRDLHRLPSLGCHDWINAHAATGWSYKDISALDHRIRKSIDRSLEFG